MTPRMEFDDQLRAWADLGDERLPVQYLNGALDQIETTPQARPAWWRFPEMNRFAPFAMAATALIVVLLIGISLFVRAPDVGPTPLPNPSDEANATPSPDGPLGGGLILVTLPHESASPCDMGGFAPFKLYSLDAGTGEQTFLGTTAEDCSARQLNLQWAPDREHVLMTDELGQETLTLDTSTAAGRDLTFICCNFPTDIWEGGAHQFDGWLLSPAGDRVAAIHTSQFQAPGQEGTTGISDGIVVANIDGTGRTFLPLPAGAAIRGWANWSPDQSALVVAACLPCNHAALGEPATAVNHDHVYIVPVDGSPVRELLDDTAGWWWTPVWSPDGSTVVTLRRECRAEWVPMECSGEATTSLVLVDVEDGTERLLLTTDQLGEGFSDLGMPAWSPDGRRIAFSDFSATDSEPRPHVFVVDANGTNLIDLGAGDLMQWSPDGEWLMVDRPAGEDGFSNVWIMRPDGSDARSLGTFLRWVRAAAW